MLAIVLFAIYAYCKHNWHNFLWPRLIAVGGGLAAFGVGPWRQVVRIGRAWETLKVWETLQGRGRALARLTHRCLFTPGMANSGVQGTASPHCARFAAPDAIVSPLLPAGGPQAGGWGGRFAFGPGRVGLRRGPRAGEMAHWARGCYAFCRPQRSGSPHGRLEWATDDADEGDFRGLSTGRHLFS